MSWACPPTWRQQLRASMPFTLILRSALAARRTTRPPRYSACAAAPAPPDSLAAEPRAGRCTRRAMCCWRARFSRRRRRATAARRPPRVPAAPAARPCRRSRLWHPRTLFRAAPPSARPTRPAAAAHQSPNQSSSARRGLRARRAPRAARAVARSLPGGATRLRQVGGGRRAGPAVCGRGLQRERLRRWGPAGCACGAGAA
jgi:hypothetical protein